MAPRKKAEGAETTTPPPSSSKRETRSSCRMTRSSAKRLNAKLTELPTESSQKRKQGNGPEQQKKKKEKKVKTEVKEETVTETEAATGAQADVKEEAEAGEDEDGDKDKEEDAKTESSTGDKVNKTIVIEHCKQCNSFKTRAIQVQDGLLSAFPGITVLLNPEKPRKGCFEIREKGGETFISLQDMKRPFPPLKALDMDRVISDIIDRVKISVDASQ